MMVKGRVALQPYLQIRPYENTGCLKRPPAGTLILYDHEYILLQRYFNAT